MVLQPRQFVQNRLFARPSELRAEGIEFSDGEGQDTKRRKLAESRGEGLYDSIAAEGVREPVEVFARRGEPWLTDGHHRFFTAEEQGDRWLPLEYVGAGKQKRLWEAVEDSR